MAAEKSLALVLRVVEFSETSCIVTLFTEDFGKIGALAKGARRKKSPFESALDLLAICRVVFLPKSGDSLALLTEAKLERRFRAAEQDLSRLYCGYYIGELIQELTDLHDPHPDLFRGADMVLQDLDGRGQGAAPASLVLWFELTALRILGHAPELDQCVGCGIDLRNDKRFAFGMLSGGLLCPKCRPGKRSVVSVSSEGVETLRRFAASPSPLEAGDVPERNRGEIRGVTSHYLAHLLGHRLRMDTYLGFLAGRATAGERTATGQA